MGELTNRMALTITGLCLAASCGLAQQPDKPMRLVPDWAPQAIFYQIFPERFRNGDANNDPTYESLEYRNFISGTWKISSWTGDWYARSDWEKASGDNFYDNGVFHRRYGGDLQGVIDKLDYLKELGVNTLYFNPVFYARSMHKYDGNTFHHIDPYFGPDPEGDLKLMETETSDPQTWRWTTGDRLFLELIRKAHSRDLRVIIDGVFNHTGRDFFAFADLRRRQADSPYKDWYIVERFDDAATDANEFKYEGWWGVESLPVFADNEDGTDLHPGPKKYVFDSTRRWMDPNGDGDPDDGIDGWRLDVAAEVPIQFWSSWNTLVREINPEAYTVAELWGEAAETLVKGKFSATMNYRGFAFPVKGFLVDAKISARDFAADITRQRNAYPASMRTALQNLVDSHDTERIASMIVNASQRDYRQPEKYDYDVGELASPRYFDKYRIEKPSATHRRIQKMIALFQFTYVGAPMIYYGTEAGMWGADDPDDRKPMLWDDLHYDRESSSPNERPRSNDEVRFDHSLYAFYGKLTRLRSRHDALTSGRIDVLHAADSASTLAFLRRSETEKILVVFNRSAEAKTVRLPLTGAPTNVFISSESDADLQIDRNENSCTIRLNGLTAAAIVLK